MIQLVAVTPERHASKAWKKHASYAFAATDCVIPLVGAELSKAVPALPIGFTRDADRYQLVAITSLRPGENLFVAPSGQWLGAYIPAALRGYPFRLVQPEGAEQAILCIDEASGLVVEAAQGGEAFFDDQGQPSQVVKDTLDFLSQVERYRALTQQAVNTLADANLITAWPLNLKQGEQIVPVTGLYRIDEAALNTLDGVAFLTLRQAGALLVAYAQLLSINQLEGLGRLAQMQGQLLAQQKAQAQQQTIEQAFANLEGFTLSQDDKELKFL